MKENKFSFTDVRVKAIAAAEKGKRAHYYDTKSPGLELVVTDKGNKTFYTNRWFAQESKKLRINIGKHPAIKVSDARKANEKNIRMIASGINPQSDKIALKNELTLGQLHSVLLEDYYKTVKPKSYNNFARLMQPEVIGEGRRNRDRGHLYHLRNKKLSSIKKQDVVRIRNQIAENAGKVAANTTIKLLCSMYNKATDYGYEGDNPAERVDYYHTNSRDRVLKDYEKQPFYSAVLNESNTDVRDIIMILALTGVRKSHVLSMRWEDIDFQSRVWLLRDTKNNTPQKVCLHDHLIALLQSRDNIASEFVFPSDSESGHVVDIKKGWKRILKKADIEELRVHDLRRTFASTMANQGTEMRIIQHSMNHKSSRATNIYARINLDTQWDSVKKAADEILVSGGIKLRA